MVQNYLEENLYTVLYRKNCNISKEQVKGKVVSIQLICFSLLSQEIFQIILLEVKIVDKAEKTLKNILYPFYSSYHFLTCIKYFKLKIGIFFKTNQMVIIPQFSLSTQKASPDFLCHSGSQVIFLKVHLTHIYFPQFCPTLLVHPKTYCSIL